MKKYKTVQESANILFVSADYKVHGQEMVSVIDVKSFKFAISFIEDMIISTELLSKNSTNNSISKRYNKKLTNIKPPGKILEQIIEYFNGKNVQFACKLLSPDSNFRLDVYQSLLKTEPGQTISYRQLAVASGHAKAIRAVGAAMKNNPYPVIIPCHRVIKSDGTLGNYSGGSGTKTKEYLLKLEMQSRR